MRSPSTQSLTCMGSCRRLSFPWLPSNDLIPLEASADSTRQYDHCHMVAAGGEGVSSIEQGGGGELLAPHTAAADSDVRAMRNPVIFLDDTNKIISSEIRSHNE